MKGYFRSAWWGAIAAFSLVGCTTLPVSAPNISALLPKSADEPTQMVVTVQPSVLQEEGIPKHTGMMCRAYFFAGKDPVPMKASGDWTVIAFESPAGTSENPQGLYKVAAKDLETHYRKDVVGDSYVFWFPYETSEVAQLQLQGTLKLADGKEIKSSWLKLRLDPAQGMKGKSSPITSTTKPSKKESLAASTEPPTNSTDAGQEKAGQEK
jgi:hypothetical protein